MKPGFICGGAVLSPEAALPLGEAPEGTSMKVFFTGSAAAAFVSGTPALWPKAASERGTGRFGGIALCSKGCNEGRLQNWAYEKSVSKLQAH